MENSDNAPDRNYQVFRITHAEYGHDLPDRSHIPKLRFLKTTLKGLPLEATQDNKVIQLTASDKEIDTADFTGFRPFIEPDKTDLDMLALPEPVDQYAIAGFEQLGYMPSSHFAKKLVIFLAKTLYYDYLTQMKLQEMNDRLMETATYPGQELSPNPTHSKETAAFVDSVDYDPSLFYEQLSPEEQAMIQKELWSEYAGPKAMEWLRGVGKNGLEIRQHEIKIRLKGKNTTVNRLIIGNVTPTLPDIWETDRQILETLCFMQDVLGLEVPDDMTFFSIATFDATDSFHRFIPNLVKITGCGGRYFAESRDAVLFEYGRRRIKDLTLPDDKRQSYLRISDNTSNETGAHEAAHLGDSYEGTSVQREAFAVCLENGMSFQRIKEIMRDSYDYGRKISHSQLENLLSSTVRDDIPSVEKYYLSGTFFAYVFEKLGPEKFIQFYGLLSGAKDAVIRTKPAVQGIPGESEYLIEDHVADRRNQNAYLCKGNLEATLKFIQHGTDDFKGRKFIKDYLREVNKPSPKLD